LYRGLDLPVQRSTSDYDRSDRFQDNPSHRDDALKSKYLRFGLPRELGEKDQGQLGEKFGLRFIKEKKKPDQIN
jgi:hypothetical protein